MLMDSLIIVFIKKIISTPLYQFLSHLKVCPL